MAEKEGKSSLRYAVWLLVFLGLCVLTFLRFGSC